MLLHTRVVAAAPVEVVVVVAVVVVVSSSSAAAVAVPKMHITFVKRKGPAAHTKYSKWPVYFSKPTWLLLCDLRY